MKHHGREFERISYVRVPRGVACRELDARTRPQPMRRLDLGPQQLDAAIEVDAELAQARGDGFGAFRQRLDGSEACSLTHAHGLSHGTARGMSIMGCSSVAPAVFNRSRMSSGLTCKNFASISADFPGNFHSSLLVMATKLF
mgnify:CR=1 FL=1